MDDQNISDQDRQGRIARERARAKAILAIAREISHAERVEMLMDRKEGAPPLPVYSPNLEP